MKSTIILNYEICEEVLHPINVWSTFISLVNRDYDELMAKSLNEPSSRSDSSIAETAIPISSPTSHNECISESSPSVEDNIVDEENRKFLEQINLLNGQSKPKVAKRQVKLVFDNPRVIYLQYIF